MSTVVFRFKAPARRSRWTWPTRSARSWRATPGTGGPSPRPIRS